ncbi:MAG: Crp/Fnr family transcriptional regulator [Bacteroidales bacterium]|nr:Crp/Fnr family transcriptional regulator [Bacteroidales bacterium]
MNHTIINCELFRGINISELEDLLTSVTHKNYKFSKDEIITSSRNEVRGLYILMLGSVRGEMVDFSGKVIKIEDIESPRMLAPAFLFGKNNNYPVDIIANNNTEFIYFHRSSFLKLLQLNQTVLMNYLNIISDRAQFLSTKIRFLSFQTIKGKFAHYIINLINENNKEDIILPLSQSKLADLFGVTRPALGRVIRELHNNKIIIAENKRIKILNKSQLVELMK